MFAAACLYFQKIGVTTARFNFCGSQIGWGDSQVSQIQQIADLLLASDDEGTPKYILLVGYSYGSLISSSASNKIKACIGVIAIAPPFAVRHWLLMFNSNRHLDQAASRTDLPRLFVLGDTDNFTSEAAFASTVEKYFPNDESTSCAILKDADHFFRHREKDLMNVIGLWLKKVYLGGETSESESTKTRYRGFVKEEDHKDDEIVRITEDSETEKP